MSEKINVFWFRRDLRLEDNVGFNNALQEGLPVLPIFIFDSEILSELPKDDARVNFIFDRLQNIRGELGKYHSGLSLYYGKPVDVFKKIISAKKVQSVFVNSDYEPYATYRDHQIERFLSQNNIPFYTSKDQVIFEQNEVVKDNGEPYAVYTPYMKSWKEKFHRDKGVKINAVQGAMENLYRSSHYPNLSLDAIGFKKSALQIPEYDVSPATIREYETRRDFPSQNATTHLGPHLRFGTVSIRKIIKRAMEENNGVFLQELIWREFFMQILWHFPETVNNAFKKKYNHIPWRNNESEFEIWKQGKTGYPLVDAGMRQLNETGYMHNRVRMVTASFLCKHLLIDWRWGEAYFAEKLLDYEMSTNVGSWQWAAGTGADAAPYFRMFNPTRQVEKFDKNLKYISKWIPELNSPEYPGRIVDHKEARNRFLIVFKTAISY